MSAVLLPKPNFGMGMYVSIAYSSTSVYRGILFNSAYNANYLLLLFRFSFQFSPRYFVFWIRCTLLYYFFLYVLSDNQLESCCYILEIFTSLLSSQLRHCISYNDVPVTEKCHSPKTSLCDVPETSYDDVNKTSQVDVAKTKFFIVTGTS